LGLLRIVLALTVVIAHIQRPFLGLRFADGELAVETFFIISGFYMALILSTRYRFRPASFYFNRFLRLFPTYWMLLAVFAIGASAAWLIVGRPPEPVLDWSRFPGGWSVRISAIAANLFMVGTDALFWVRNGAYSGYLVMPQVWSVSVEILFYLFAPLILRSSLRVQVLLFIAGAVGRQALWTAHGGAWSMWTFCFPPSTVPFFMAGVLSYRLYLAMSRSPALGPRLGPIGRFLAIALVGAIVLQNQDDFLGNHRWAYYGFVALSLPFVFAATKDDAADSWLGQWSYPIYISHWVVLEFFGYVAGRVRPGLVVYAVVAATFALSFAVGTADQAIQRRFKRRV
jgi:peptidoglycan/LPS O-acetylase OafA/YrhL